MWFCKNSGKQSRKKHFFKFWGPKLFLIEHCELKLYVWQCFWGISYYVSTIYAKSHEKSHRLWTQNQSLARGLLALQTKIPLGINFLGPWEGGIWSRFFFITLTSPSGQPSGDSPAKVLTKFCFPKWQSQKNLALHQKNPLFSTFPTIYDTMGSKLTKVT